MKIILSKYVKGRRIFMTLDFTLWLYQQLELLTEPTRILVYIVIYMVLPLLCLGLLYLDKKYN